MSRWDRVKVWLISWLGASIVRALALTWRVRFVQRQVVDDFHQRQESFVYVLWHGQLLPLLWTHRHSRVSVIISEHRDGEIIARIAHSLGFRTVRGSTSRGAARALLSASRELEGGWDLAVTVDGPRGPAGVVAPGALIIAHRTNSPMVPTGAAADRAWRLRSWDRFLIPKPFARVTVAYGRAVRLDVESPREAATRVDEMRAAIDDAAALAAAG